MNLPYADRLEFMQNLPDQAHRMEKDGDVLTFYNQAINDGFEGIMVKDAKLEYEPSTIVQSVIGLSISHLG